MNGGETMAVLLSRGEQTPPVVRIALPLNRYHHWLRRPRIRFGRALWRLVQTHSCQRAHRRPLGCEDPVSLMIAVAATRGGSDIVPHARDRPLRRCETRVRRVNAVHRVFGRRQGQFSQSELVEWES
jgi:hypothetical protein